MPVPEPSVSVVIPTRNRPRLVVRAVRGALSQTLRDIEVIVIIDGPDEATRQALCRVDDPRVVVRELPVNRGPGAARNAGVGEARSQWVAFLDDDDEWLPQKLETQLRTGQQSGYLYPIVSCHMIVRSEMGDRVWPRRGPSPSEPVSEYVLCQRTEGEGLVQPSTVLTRTELARRVPFRNLPKHEDLDWLLRACTVEGVGVAFVPMTDPLAIWHREERRGTRANRPDWRISFAWIGANRNLVTPRAYASFLLTWVSSKAAQTGDWRAFPLLLKEAYLHGQPAVTDVLLCAGIWLIPRSVRRRIAPFLRALTAWESE